MQYSVSVYGINYIVTASSYAESAKKGLDRWRIDHNAKDRNDNYRIPEPTSTVVTFHSASNPKEFVDEQEYKGY